MNNSNTGILLESGTNEFEIIEFSIGKVAYGINVAKVREVINPVPVTPMVKAHPYLDGTFILRGKVIPLVNLARSLGVTSTADSYKFIVCEINNLHVGFKVEDIHRIYRVFWTQMEPPPKLAGSELTIGIVKIEDKMILLLDFERILSEIDPEINEKMSAQPKASPDLVEARKSRTILVAEDSMLLRQLLVGTLQSSGYNTISTPNGQEAWEKLNAFSKLEEPVQEHVQLVVTDIEMPKMDGHFLTKCIKDNRALKDLPVIIFSSLINEEIRRKGEALGACAQITKPEIAQLIDLVDKYIGISGM